MKQKIQLYRPVVAVLFIALGAVCAATWFFDFQLFVIVATISGGAAFWALILFLSAHRDADRFVASMGRAIGAMQTDTLVNFPLPVIIVDERGEMVWYNEKCGREVLEGEDWYGRPAADLLGEGWPDLEDGFVHRGQHYALHAVTSERAGAGVTACYLVEDTEMRRDAMEYHLSRPSVWMIKIDSVEDLLQSAKENERSQMLAQIEYRIESFVSEHGGITIKTDRDRFVAVLEERRMQGIVERRFELLDTVRALATGDQLPVTLSIGVSRLVESFPEGEQAARQALDMAQGRGGDQAAVKTTAGYDFYGGVSKGIEKRTKVKTRIVATALRELIESSSNVLLMGHKYADLDCLGAAVGLMKPIRQMGKHCVVAVNRSRNLVGALIERLELNGYEGAFVNPSEAMERIGPQTLLIVVDTHLVNVLESADLYRACKNIVVIDHHRRMVGYIDNAVIFYHEPYASSASEMVTELAQYFGDKNRIGRVEAEALLAGIMLDTKNFVIRTGVRTFEAAAYLRRQGADTVEVRKLFSSTMESYQHRSRLVAAAEVYHRCAIACTNAMTEDVKLIAPQAADELLTISDVDASFVLYEYDGGISISSRSMGKVNVQLIMEVMGGGGHMTMAAVQLTDISMESARQKLLDAIEEYFANNQKQGS